MDSILGLEDYGLGDLSQNVNSSVLTQAVKGSKIVLAEVLTTVDIQPEDTSIGLAPDSR